MAKWFFVALRGKYEVTRGFKMETKYFKNLSLKDKILYLLCCHACGLDMSGYDCITTTGSIAKRLNCSQYMVRKYLKELEQDGLAQRVCVGGCADDELRVWCIKGWCITSKARYTDVFKRANWHESKIMWEVWQIVPSQYYATNTAQWHDRLSKKG